MSYFCHTVFLFFISSIPPRSEKKLLTVSCPWLIFILKVSPIQLDIWQTSKKNQVSTFSVLPEQLNDPVILRRIMLTGDDNIFIATTTEHPSLRIINQQPFVKLAHPLTVPHKHHPVLYLFITPIFAHKNLHTIRPILPSQPIISCYLESATVIRPSYASTLPRLSTPCVSAGIASTFTFAPLPVLTFPITSRIYQWAPDALAQLVHSDITLGEYSLLCLCLFLQPGT